MKLSNTILMLLVSISILNGCKTTPLTPLPKTASAVMVGMTYKCNKKELRKEGADLDVSSIYESVNYCYNDYLAVGYYRNCNYTVLTDSNATINNVKNAIRNAVKDEMAIIYFSCKTTQITAIDDKEEVDGLDECLRLYDGLLIDNEIWELISQSKGRVFLMFDTSHSQTLFKSNKDKEITTTDTKQELMDIDTKPSTNSFDMVCWSACLDNEKIEERGIGSRLTNLFYFKLYNRSDSYQFIYDKVYKSLSDKQNLNKTVIGNDFSNNSIFR